jgi:hypothetical protein
MILHSHFLLTKAIRRSLGLIAGLMITGLFFAAGVFEVATAKDLAAVQFPQGYWEDGWRIVRFFATMTGILLASSLFPRQANRYAVYLLSHNYRKSRFVLERMITLVLVSTIAYGFAVLALVWIGNLFVVRFELTESEILRLAYG